MSTTTTDSADATMQMIMITDQMQPLMNRLPANVQGGVLASLLANWLAGHELVGDRKGTLKLQQTIMRQHFKLIRELLQLQQSKRGREDQ